MMNGTTNWGLVTEADGSSSAAYGPFALKSAFQPIFSQSAQGLLRLEAYEALIRPFKANEPVSPAQFFPMVEAGEGANVERLCRRLHIRNASISGIGNALLFLNFDPRFFTSYAETLHEAEDLAEFARKAGLSSAQIVCEIMEKEASSRHLLNALCNGLREQKFKIAIDDYGAEDSDFDRLESLKPDVIKFDALWVHRFMETNEGIALLRAMVNQFRERGILTLFEGLEEHWQVSVCGDLGVRLLQGFALATPRLAPMKDEPAKDDEDETPVAEEDREWEHRSRAIAGRGAVDDAQAFARRPKRVAFGRRGA